jgi:poly(A) polymerase
MSIILNFLKKIVKSAGSKPIPEAPQVRIYPRSEHTISRAQISEHALKVLYRLQKSGFDAYLVGGCVRDLLLGREPKDFDVVTNAHPEQIKGVFRNCRLIGRRFRLAHVHFGNEVIEVATFRGAVDKQNDEHVTNDEGRLLRDNVYGTIEQDVWRRDFTVNALYYNIKDFSVVDYTGGMDDHKSATLRLIGDPVTRFREDPVRMLRAVRFAVKLGFKLHADCQNAIHGAADLLYSIPSARLYDEVLKLFLSGYALQTFEMLRHYGLFQVLFPDTEKSLAIEENGFPKLLLIKALQNSDNRIAEGKTVTPYFLLAAFLWEPVKMLTQLNRERGMDDYNAFQSAAGEVLARQAKSTSFPRHISIAMREVWSLQPKFEQRFGPKPARLLTHPRFRAAYDFLLIRSETGDAEPELAAWWDKFQLADEAMQKKMTQPSRNLKNSRTRRRRSSKKKNTGPTENPSI